jgi:hypothetical protein
LDFQDVSAAAGRESENKEHDAENRFISGCFGYKQRKIIDAPFLKPNSPGSQSRISAEPSVLPSLMKMISQFRPGRVRLEISRALWLVKFPG